MSIPQNVIPSDWKIVRFDDVAELRHGYQFRHYDFTAFGVKIFKITQIKGDGLTDISSCSYIDANRLSQFNKFVINKGDILIALTGATIGKIARYNGDEIILQNYRVGNFFPVDEYVLSKEYLYQFLKSSYFYNQIISGQTQSAQQNIGKEDINNMSVILPELKEQKAIASILSALDDKIELNLQMNKTLEEMAMALYKHWFVDFGPFQSGNFVESELGMIPEGWEVKRLEELGNFKNGKGLKQEDKINDGQYNVYGSNGVVGRTNKIMFHNPVIAIGRVGANYGEVHYSINPCWISDNAVTVQSIYEDCFWWLLETLRLIDYSNFVAGSAQPLITQGAIKEVKVAVFSDVELIEFSKKLRPLFSHIQANLSEIDTLITLRDTLLPKLISGEVRVKDAEQILAAAL